MFRNSGKGDGLVRCSFAARSHDEPFIRHADEEILTTLARAFNRRRFVLANLFGFLCIMQQQKLWTLEQWGMESDTWGQARTQDFALGPRRIRRRQDSKGDDDPEGGESEKTLFFDSFLCSLRGKEQTQDILSLSMDSHQGLKTLNTNPIN
ncbi:hypothetical protein CEXT_48391 [Caerostris extrusa]|uniref:Uncharacterized protein n=1 Tax=Caerostris extrusa TaxID=172846 RepID=A0AAV4N0P8_CAEEX|nr:hypothetical protein CEXT_48391 [Caerostris extrusa]